MLDRFREILHSDVSLADKCIAALFCLGAPSSPAQIKSIAAEHGLKGARDWNVGTILGRTKGRAISSQGTWGLTKVGLARAQELGLSRRAPLVTASLEKLRSEIQGLKSEQTAAFLGEAVGCLEMGWFRAAVIMSWVAAAHVLQEFVVSAHLSAFNAEALRRNPKWEVAKDTDDVARMGEAEMLDVMAKIGVLQKNTKNELKICLDRRNACGHPNSYVIAELTAAHHVEVLVVNVFSKY